ncbi:MULTISPECIES: CAP domain-containing protein [unclassified Aureispira]|uniref:CAP domain-containing protein n=1 Tax=unclassified Aureispira TaxID=2649989 RepID=UPI0006987F27|nr:MULTISPECIES: CAP domain-containing protein [unclassified Aureispira]WMX13507.1 CAP domain-containing protein [Aureispira sp. CCB-E]
MTNISDLELEILELINQHRASLNLTPLSIHPSIQNSSFQHSTNIAKENIPFGHEGFSERANTLVQVLNGSAAAENVAMGQRSAKEVVDGWLNSSGHRNNIEGDFNLTGISIVKNSQNENIFTQLFIKAPVTNLDTLEPSQEGTTDVNLNYAILKLINKHRSGQYLPPLQINPHIQAIATQHAQAMASGKIPFGHQGFEDRAKQLLSKLHGSSVAENVASGQENAPSIVNSWLDSSSHRNNIEGDFNLTGIGIAKSETQKVFYCQILIKK